MSEQFEDPTSEYETAADELTQSQQYLEYLSLLQKTPGFEDESLTAECTASLASTVKYLESFKQDLRDAVIADFNSQRADLVETKSRVAKHGLKLNSLSESAYRDCFSTFKLGSQVCFKPRGRSEARLAHISSLPRLCLYPDGSQIAAYAEIGLISDGVEDYELFPIMSGQDGFWLAGIAVVAAES